MSETRRTKRSAREDPELGSRRQSKVKYIYRLLRERDVGESLEGKTVYVLWPDDGTWYKGHVEECDVAAKKATIFYDETDEREEGADLDELIRDGQIAFKEPRPASHVCRKGEIEVGAKYFGRQPGEEDLEDDLEEAPVDGSGSDLADAGALEDTSDSDVSFSSAELSGRKRKRGGDDDSDEDVVLEEFEKREIMRDMSDDEKPLGWRASELEQQQKKASAAARRQDSGAGSGKKGAAPAASAGTSRKAAASASTSTGRPAAAAAAARPAQRPRREASMGVKLAAHAVAAVNAAAAEDASSDDEPPSARKHRQRQADDEDAADAYAAELLARATGKAPPARPGARGSASFYGASGSGSGKLERRVSSGQSEDEIRSKVRAGFQQALELVAGEAAQDAGQLPEAGPVAEAVEAALFNEYGGLSQEYKKKVRSLQFNLKDPLNPELRAHVLRGDIAPQAFVRMSPNELASKELAAYRKAKEEEALKMSVLDAEAAARFSTAAALDARDQLAIPASVMSDKGMLAAREGTPEPAGPGSGAAALSPTAAAAAAADSGLLNEQPSGRLETVGEEGGAGGASAGGYLASESAAADLAGGEEYDPETAFADEGPKTTAGTAGAAATPTAAALDWASIKAAAAAAGQGAEGAGPALQPLKFEPLATVGAKHEGQQAGVEGHRHHKRERPSASPGDQEAADAAGSQQAAEPGSPHSLRHLVLPPTDPACLFGKGVWEGQFSWPGVGAFLLTADALAGSGDVAGLLGDQDLEVKGRLALHRLEHFLSELRHSRSRTVTLGVLSPAEDCLPEERAALREFIASYAERGRIGVAEPSKDVEAYLLPSCTAAERLLSAAHSAAVPQVEALLPGGGTAIGPDQLLLCIIHRKDWRVPYGLTRPIRRPRPLPSPAAATATAPTADEPAAAPASAAGEPASAPAEQSAAPAVSLPPGLDLSQLGALAAALGVTASSPAEQQPPAAAAVPQADQLQQLLASLPPATVAPGAVQPADGGQRRSRWEGGDGSEASGQLDEQARRRSRWAEEGGSQDLAQQPPAGMLPPAGAAQPAAPGPMGPMHRAAVPPPQAMPPAMQPPGMPPAMQQSMPPPMQQPPFLTPPEQQQQQQFGGPHAGMGPPGSMPMQPQQFGGPPPPGSMPFQQQPGMGGLPPPPPMQPFPGGGPQGIGMPPQHQMGLPPPGSMPMQPMQQQPGGYGGAPAWQQGGQGPPGQYGGQYGGRGFEGRGGRGRFDQGRGRGGRWGGGGRFEGRGRGGRGRY